MTGSIQVLVRDKETQQTATLTYKAFRDTAYRFDLIGQVDDQGNLMESDPNLSPQHQRKVSEKSPAAADAGEIPELLTNSGRFKGFDGNILEQFSSTGSPPPLVLSEVSTNAESTPLASSDGISTSDTEVFHVEQQSPEAVTDSVQEPIKERKKPGPKPKNKDL